MNDRINHILAQMAALEADPRSAVHDEESRMFFQINGKRVEFQQGVLAAIGPQGKKRKQAAPSMINEAGRDMRRPARLSQ